MCIIALSKLNVTVTRVLTHIVFTTAHAPVQPSQSLAGDWVAAFYYELVQGLQKIGSP